MKSWNLLLREQLRAVLHGDFATVFERFQRWRGLDFGRVESLQIRLQSLGFTESALAELNAISLYDSSSKIRVEASLALAVWHMSLGTPEGRITARRYLEQAKASRRDRGWLRKLAALQLHCDYALGDIAGAERTHAEFTRLGALTPAALLAWANCQPSLRTRVEVFNRALSAHKVSPVALSDDPHRSPFERLRAQAEPNAVRQGPKISVIVPLCGEMSHLASGFQSIQEQSWRNLEIIAVGDDDLAQSYQDVVRAFATKDERINVVRVPGAGGDYAACNHALDLSSGEFVTVFRPGEWAHPQKLERQAQCLMRDARIIGCTAQRAVCTPDLIFLWGNWPLGGSIHTSMSSLMFRREPMRETLGYWDTVRCGADAELVHRMRHVFGENAVRYLETGPVSLACMPEVSAIESDLWAERSGKAHGATRLYQEIQSIHRSRSPGLRYDNNPERRPFPVPRGMRKPQVEVAQVAHYDVVIASDFRMKGGSTQSNVQEVLCQRRAGIKTALLPMYRYDYLPSSGRDHPAVPAIWDLVDGSQVEMLAYGENVTCDLLVLRYPPILYHRQHLMPRIEAKEIRVVVNQTPMSDYGPDGVVRYELGRCVENIRESFGKNAIWHPIGPLVRDALHERHASDLSAIQLSDTDWVNIIDVDEWDRGKRSRGPGDTLRIGRHSRDDSTKWPDCRAELLAAYPAADDIEVHVLGGARAPAKLLGGVPANWVVHEFGALAPKAFLAGIDVFVYFTSPTLVESFGRCILEAMAAGVPVIVPSVYRPLFGDAVLYATTETAVSLARELHQDPEGYERQVKHAQDYVREKFGYEMHLRRLKGLGVRFSQ